MFRPITPFIDYAINYDYITNFLCENKNNKEMQCNGKCYVMKQLKQQQNEDLKSLEISIKEYPIGFVSVFKLDYIISSNKTIKQQPLYYEKNHSHTVIKSKYRPPEIT